MSCAALLAVIENMRVLKLLLRAVNLTCTLQERHADRNVHSRTVCILIVVKHHQSSLDDRNIPEKNILTFNMKNINYAFVVHMLGFNELNIKMYKVIIRRNSEISNLILCLCQTILVKSLGENANYELLLLGSHQV